MKVLTLVPARKGSKGVKDKNFRRFWRSESLVALAVKCACEAGFEPVVSTDGKGDFMAGHHGEVIARPPELSDDRAPMRDVVRHAMETYDWIHDVVILLQPTSPLRVPAHLHAGLKLLTPHATSVVSVTEVPASYNRAVQLTMAAPKWPDDVSPLEGIDGLPLDQFATTRQAVAKAYVRDGTIYVVRAENVRAGRFYGDRPHPLVVPAEMSISIDTMADWYEAQRLYALRSRNEALEKAQEGPKGKPWID